MRYLFIALLILAGAVIASAQDAQCPAGYVCITREAAIANLQRDDHAKAVEAENAVLKQAIEDHKKIESDLKVELAKTTGTLTGCQQNAVSDRAIIDILVKNTRAKRIGLINLF